jgi:alginate O-acetyltransferase complex protein AlgJ
MSHGPRESRAAVIVTSLVFVTLVSALWLTGWRELAAALQGSGKPAEQRLQAAMPFRAEARRLWNGVRWQVTGSTPPTVVKGRDGWWFYASEQAGDGHSLDELEGRVEPDAAEADWAGAIRARAATAQARGARYLVVVPPDKHTICADHLPESMHVSPAPTRLDRLGAALGADSPLLDLRGAVSAGYPQSDSHWLDAGAYEGYLAIHRRLGLHGEPVPRSAFIAKPYDWPGDLWALRQAGERTERVELWQAVAPLPAHWLGGEAVARPGLFHLPAAQAAWRVSAGGWREAITTVDDPHLPTAVIFHDSFMPALLPYLAQHFRRVRFVWCHYLQPVVDAEQPDLVIHENVARNVQWLGKVSDVY